MLDEIGQDIMTWLRFPHPESIWVDSQGDVGRKLGHLPKAARH